MASLCIKFPDRRGEMTHLLDGKRITIGRTPDNTIQIIDRTVSGHHAELVLLNGHYRLHDLGSTNLTCVDGQPITDYHLHSACKVLFGTVECEFVPTCESVPQKSVAVPTRAEIDFLERENEEMKASVRALGKQIEILNSARLVAPEAAVQPVSPEEHRKLTTECIALRSENESLRRALEGLKADLANVSRDRDGILHAWETLKREAERRQVDEKPKVAPQPPQTETPPTPEAKEEVAESVEAENAVPVSAPPAAMSENAIAEAVDGECAPCPPEPVMLPAAQAATAEVLAQTSPLIESLRVALAEAGNGQTRNDVILGAAALIGSLQQIQGHPVQRLVQSIEALLHDPYAFTPGPMRTLHQAGDLVHLLTGHKHLEPSKTLSQPRALVIDDDEELVAALTATFEAADILTIAASSPSAALSILQSHHFDLILLDIAMPEESGIELCPKIHEILGSRQTPIVFLTARDTLENRAQARLSGGNDFISKPFNTRELTLKAQLWIYRYQLSLM